MFVNLLNNYNMTCSEQKWQLNDSNVQNACKCIAQLQYDTQWTEMAIEQSNVQNACEHIE